MKKKYYFANAWTPEGNVELDTHFLLASTYVYPEGQQSWSLQPSLHKDIDGTTTEKRAPELEVDPETCD